MAHGQWLREDPAVAVPERAGTNSSGPRAESARLSRLPSLTGLRFPAALLVFLYHAALPIPALRLLQDDSVVGDFYLLAGQAGGLGVTFFFVLSGFVLTWSVRKQDTARAFWRRRFVKIYPNYVVAWVLAMVLFASAYTSTGTALANLLMVQVWSPDFNTYFSVDPPSWSLGAEAVFYAAFPLLNNAFRRIAPAHLKYWIIGAIVVVVATPALAYALLTNTPGIPGGETSSVVQYWVAYVLPPVRIVDFALGMLVAHAVANGRWRDIGMAWSGLLLVVGYTLTAYVPYLYGQRAACVVPVVLLIAAAARADVENRPSPFRNRAMIWLGEISFAFYLLHFVVLAYGRELLGVQMYSTAATALLLIASAAVTVVLSWALYAWVEAPVTRRWSKSRRDGRTSFVPAEIKE
ncbi:MULTISPECIES: acyltransferase family protein [unclassified Streptomyces]|uniref:acyltransferase family protein n=1 Tax=unclassified Streptomyces TaxID=2593676 RepID=UPI000DAB7A2D|nr:MULTISPECIES: acyltransferase [unclassified Streptomyces]PZT74844.1 acyltransferase [Streptomyces sp. AC1-42T]PZT82172.1 acyltransferase [Streptomyces sp. AC1-42W]